MFECSFVANSALGQSGVLGLISGLTTSVVGCNFTANTSPDGIGSGVFAVSQTSSLTVANSTFLKNGGMYSFLAVVSTLLDSYRLEHPILFELRPNKHLAEIFLCGTSKRPRRCDCDFHTHCAASKQHLRRQ